MLNQMEDSRPGNSTLGVIFCAEFVGEVEYAKILHVHLSKWEKQSYDHCVSLRDRLLMLRSTHRDT